MEVVVEGAVEGTVVEAVEVRGKGATELVGGLLVLLQLVSEDIVLPLFLGGRSVGLGRGEGLKGQLGDLHLGCHGGSAALARLITFSLVFIEKSQYLIEKRDT